MNRPNHSSARYLFTGDTEGMQRLFKEGKIEHFCSSCINKKQSESVEKALRDLMRYDTTTVTNRIAKMMNSYSTYYCMKEKKRYILPAEFVDDIFRYD